MSENFDRNKVCYDQNFAQFRSLNEQMVRIPTIAVTITGGLWFLVSTTESPINFYFLVFAGIVNISLAISCIRIRDVMTSYMEKIEQFSPENYATGRPNKPVFGFLKNYSMIIIYTSLMVISGYMSFVLSVEQYWPSDNLSQASTLAKDVARFVLYILIPVVLFLMIRKDQNDQE